MQAETVIIKCVQQEIFLEVLKSLSKGKKIPDQSQIKCLNPIIDKDGLVRVRQRLFNADMAENEKHPIIIPANHHIATLLVKHYYEKVAHQGLHFTEGVQQAYGLLELRSSSPVLSISV